MAYLEVTADLKAKINEFLGELETIETRSQKTAGKRARVLFTEIKKLNRPWKLALKERESNYVHQPKKVKAEAAAV
jgi:hypothetical protein